MVHNLHTMNNHLILTSFLLFFICSALSQQGGNEMLFLQEADSSYAFKKWGEKDDPLKADLYSEARRRYSKVLLTFPDNSYARNRIIEIDRILNDFKNEPEYTKTLEMADSLYENYECELSLRMYIKSDSISTYVIDPKGITFLKDRIRICNDALNIETSDSSLAFIEAVQVADELYYKYLKDRERDANNLSILDSSYIHYFRANAIYGKSTYIQEKIGRIDKIKANYDKLLQSQLFEKGVLHYENKEYEKALLIFEYLLKLKPSNTYIEEMIDKCKSEMK